MGRGELGAIVQILPPVPETTTVLSGRYVFKYIYLYWPTRHNRLVRSRTWATQGSNTYPRTVGGKQRRMWIAVDLSARLSPPADENLPPHRYEAGNGIKASMSGENKAIGGDPEKMGIVMQGSYSYTTPEGFTYTVK